MKVLFFVVFPDVNAGSRYRVYKYLKYLEKDHIQYTVCPPMSNSLFCALYQSRGYIRKILFYLIAYATRLVQLMRIFNYDVIFIHQGLTYLGPPVLESMIAKFKKTIIFDVDDAHFAKPAFATGFAAKFHDRERVAKLARISKHVIVSVDSIKQYVKTHNPNVTIIPTSIDMDRYQSKDYAKNSAESVIIGWAGSASGFIYLHALEDVFKELARSFDVKLKIISSCPLKMSGIEVINCRWSLQNEISDLQSLDIGIMPLFDSEFEKGKGGFKLIQYMGVGLPVVCSPVGVNTQIVKEGSNGFFASSKAEWIDKLTLLIRDQDLRKTIGKRAKVGIEDRFTIEGNVATFVKVIKDSLR